MQFTDVTWARRSKETSTATVVTLCATYFAGRGREETSSQRQQRQKTGLLMVIHLLLVFLRHYVSEHCLHTHHDSVDCDLVFGNIGGNG